MRMVDTDPLAPLQRSVAAILAAGVPGAHLSVRAPDVELDWCEGLAQAFDDGGPCPRPLTVDTAHDLGSVTKVAGTMSMLVALASVGEVDPDDPVGRYVPEFAESLHGSDGPATLADLLTHRAGLWEWWPIYLTAATDPLAVVRSLPLRYPTTDRTALLRPGLHDSRPGDRTHCGTATSGGPPGAGRRTRRYRRTALRGTTGRVGGRRLVKG